MSYLERENSISEGRPIRLYRFERGATWRYGYTNADQEIIYQGVRYETHPISDDGIRITGESTADTLVVTAGSEIPPALLFRGTPPADEVFLTMFDYHYGEPDLPASAWVAWQGSITTVRFPEVDRCEISCNALSATMHQLGLTLTWERGCNRTVYGPMCRADPILHRFKAEVMNMTGAVITHNASLTGQFAGGFVEWQADGNIERRCIVSENGYNITLLGGTNGLALGQSIFLYRGCDSSITCCDSRFNNLPNHGGVRHLPGKSPFDGSPIF